jgi:hypothetical protein
MKAEPTSTEPPTSSEFERFQEFAKKIVAVPKREIDKQAAKEERKAQKKRAPYKHIAG